MRLATFNIYWLGGDKIARSEQDHECIAQVIAKLDADALVFQEIVEPAALEHILHLVVGLTSRNYRMRDGQGEVLGTTGSGLKTVSAYDAQCYELLAASPLFGGVGRLPYALRLHSVDETGADVLMIGVHFQSGYPVFTDEEDAERRRSQCQHLAEWIAGEGTADNPALPAPLPGEHVAILGDFNALIESDVPGYEAVVQSLAPLRQGHMADWWWEKPLPDPAGGGQVTSYLEGYLIDFVMLSPSLRSRIVQPPTIYAFDRDEEIGASGVQLSDHRPVYVEIDIRQDETVTPDHSVATDTAFSGSGDQKLSETKLHARLALGTRDRELAQRHARHLTDLGFTVVQVASRGVSFEGTITQFESTFESEVEASEEGAQFRQAPTIPEAMEEQVESVYFPTKPTFFAKSVDAGRNPLLSGRGESGRRHPDAK